MRFRQVHLDFHTSEHIPEIGSKFSKEQFQEALRIGHVNSITVFSKCHHGWAYHPSAANEMHPKLSFDLLGAEIEAAHEIGVRTPVYISAGFDEKNARRHPEWLIRPKGDRLDWQNAGYHELCMNTPYLDHLIKQIEETVSNYDCDGLFLDIVGVRKCYCQSCISSLIDAGRTPYDENDHLWLGEKVYASYAKRVEAAVHKIKPSLPIFHNSGHVSRGRRDLAGYSSHLELESLPTGGWGYDHFPLSAGYARTLGMEFLGMTGKFHTTWGEFGGFKHPNALRYEEALCIANGAGCSVGDQMHPDGYMDIATYRLIGEAYSEVEKKEPWLTDVTSVADIALLSEEAVRTYDKSIKASGNADTGAARMLLEGNYLFDIIDVKRLVDGIDSYKLLILPDCVRLDDTLTKAIKSFTKKGGKVLASGVSGLGSDNSFKLSFGCEYVGENELYPTYFKPKFDTDVLSGATAVIYSRPQVINSLSEDNILIEREDPYFNRTALHFSSHRHTPNDKSKRFPAATEGEDGIYIAADIFNEYAEIGDISAKLMTHKLIDKLLGDKKTLITSLPAQGVVTLMEQKDKNRFICHLLYASPVKRGKNTEIIEDIIPLYDVKVSVKTEKIPQKVYLAPTKTEIPFDFDGERISFAVSRLENHAMTVIEF